MRNLIVHPKQRVRRFDDARVRDVFHADLARAVHHCRSHGDN
jgi:hypothetical protein